MKYCFKKLATVVLILLFMGCDDVSTDKTDSKETDNSLDGKEFIATEIVQDGSAKDVVTDTTVSIRFNSNGSISASTGCNSLFGDYTIKNNVLSVFDIGSTLMGCDSERSEQEQLVQNLLTSSPEVLFDEDTITLVATLADGSELKVTLLDKEVATPDLALSQGTWKVNAIIVDSTHMGSDWGNPATFTFNDDGTFTLFTGCKPGKGNYAVEENEITFPDYSVTEIACENFDTSLETAVLNMLNSKSAITFDIDADRLTLMAGDNGLSLKAQTE